MVQVAESRLRQLQSAEADVIQGLIVQYDALVGVLDQLVEGERRIVGLDDHVGDFGGGDDGKGSHDAIGVLLAQFLDQ